MKPILENWNKYIKEEQLQSSIWYHTTSPKALPLIEKNGLKVGSEAFKSQGSLDYMKAIYGMIPLFISKEKGMYKNGVALKLDLTGLSLVADIPTLIDFGGQMEPDYIWFEEDHTPFELFDVVDGDGAIYFEDLINPNSNIARAIINFTKTAAVMQDIGPERIEVIGQV